VNKFLIAPIAAAAVLLGTGGLVSAQDDDGYVNPGLDVSGFTVECVEDAPYIVYDIQPIGFEWPGTATLTIFDVEGNQVEAPFEVTEKSGRFLYPGAELDENGDPIDWPGWELNADGFWVRDPSDAILREGLDILVQVNPEATIEIRYPAETPECLDPPDQRLPGSIDVSAFSPVCQNDTPFVSYDIELINLTWPGSAKLTFFDVNSSFVDEFVVSEQSGRILYPGSALDANGNPVDWPGWKLLPNGLWTIDDADAILREGLRIRVDVAGRTAVANVGYPLVSPDCNPNPPQSFPPTPPQLVTTGSNAEVVVRLAVVLLLTGVFALVATRRRRLSV
jgi:hypothetical protein